MPILYIIVTVAIAIAVFAAGFADKKRSLQVTEVPLVFRGVDSRGNFGNRRGMAGSALPGDEKLSDKQREWRNTSGQIRGVA